MIDERIERLADVRWLPKILRNKEATELFLKRGSKAAIKVLDRPDSRRILEAVTVGQLARALYQAIGSIEWTEVERLKEDPLAEPNQDLVEVHEALSSLLKHIRGG